MTGRHWIVALALTLAGCSSSDGPSAAQAEATVIREARNAIAVSAAAVAGSESKASGRWYSCVQGLAWKFDGGGTFTAPIRDPQADLAAIRAALTKAGYTNVTQVADRVSVARGVFSYTIRLRPAIGDKPPRWRFSFASRCKGYPRADRARIDSATTPTVTITP